MTYKLSDFKCCDQVFEELYSENEVISCPICHKPAVKVIGNLADYTGARSKLVHGYFGRNKMSEYKE